VKLRSLVRQSQTSVLVGAPTMGDFDKNLRFYNSAVWFGPDGEEKTRYHKMHLVPFGEYLPYEAVTGWLRKLMTIGYFHSGAEQTLFPVRSRYQKTPIEARFATLICFEDIFPEQVRGFVRRGANLLVNITNDAWFGKTAAPYQHAQASVFRAVENRVPVVRAATTGLSCFISAEGRILASVSEGGEEIEVTGVQTHNLVLRRGVSFFTWAGGPLFFWFIVALLALAWREASRRQTYFKI
jgi:apolipoprotein N-acyltransferase